jgi:dTDP-4-dehydrorhamnose reductase
MARILVIGAKGMLGRDLTPILGSSLGADIVEWDLEEVDIKDQRETIAKIENLKPEVLINVAAYTRVDDCESHTDEAFAINAEGAKHVALGALRCHAKVVYLSTDYIFDGKKGNPYVEGDPPNPLSVYGRSKLQGEEYVRTLDPEGLIVRTQWLYGEHGNNFVAAVLRQAKERRELRVVDDQTGSPTYSVDLSKVLAVLIQRNAHGIFHAVNSGQCTWYSFARKILEFTGLSGVKVIPITTEELNQPASRPRYSVLSCQKLEREIGMTLRPWWEAVRDYVESLNP